MEHPRIEVFNGYLQNDGARVQVDFKASFGSTAIEKDAAFLAALAQQGEIEYLCVGEHSTAQLATEKST
jgi:hypothetical protein